MKRYQTLLAVFLFAALPALAQKADLPLMLKGGIISPARNITNTSIDSFNIKARRYKNRTYAVLQFDAIPSTAVKEELAKHGIDLLEYVPQNAYTASINGNLNTGILIKSGVRSVIDLAPQQKMHPALPHGRIPHWAIKVVGTVDVWISFPKTFTAREIKAALQEKNIEVVGEDLQAYRILTLRMAANRLTELAAYPFIEYVQPATPPQQPLNFISRTNARAHALNAAVSNGGRGLNGEGVVIGVGDNADVQFHIDFSGRLINRSAAPHAAHGTHVTGIAAGGGIINEQQRGYASKATIVSQYFTGIIVNAASYVQDYGMVISNNSYGNILGCEYNGIYDMYSYVMDQQAFEMPHLQYVFAAGNSGSDNCAPFPTGFNTVLSGFQAAKNVISVGNTQASSAMAASSSKGPVRDGRVKPEIAAMGSNVLSTYPTNTYWYNNGTSMASPAIAGGLALLYQRYRQLHSGANPKSGLMKALLCNGAADKGNAGPDFSYGFGWMDLSRSVDMLEKGRLITGSSLQGAENTHTITVPSNTAGLKVMLYWHDPAASLISSKALVNDLDLQVKDAAAGMHLPKILDPAPANVTAPATTGADHSNNMEQVVIDNPAEGNYVITVSGTTIAQNPSQEYYVVYDVIPASTNLVYPVGGEAFAPGEDINIAWDAYGNASNTFTLQYSTDGGTNWNEIATTIEATTRQLAWKVPATITGEAQIRLLQNGTSFSSTSGNITILGTPAVSLSTITCEGYISINWTSVADATAYDVMLLRGDEMVPVATTAATSYTLNSFSKDSVYWLSVRARLGDKWGRRANAISYQPSGGNCSGSISDGDLKLNAITAPVSGRKATSSELSNAAIIKVEVKNLDDASINNFTVQYAINNGPWIAEQVTLPIAAGGTYIHTFATTADLSATGMYKLKAVVKNSAADKAVANDTLVREIKHITNLPLDLTTAFLDDFELATVQTATVATVGLNTAERYDYENTTAVGRVRTFLNSGVAFSGSRALTLDVDRNYSSGNVNYITGTYNLSAYNASLQDIRLDFQYNHHGQAANVNNKIWIRGDDTKPWIEAYDLNTNVPAAGSYKKISNIELSDIIALQGHNFTSSFQIRWGQFGTSAATSKREAGGYTIDDIRLYEAINDVQLLRIDSPAVISCGLNEASPITIAVRNSANYALNNIPVKYKVNNSTWVMETIPFIASNTTIQYTFSTKANLSLIGAHQIEAIADYATDNYRDNDTALTVLINKPVINSFPYLQNFEAGDGFWHTGGKNSSWQYGTPASDKIKGAASGAKAWKTKLAGSYNDYELSYLYSPCFDISTLQQPAISFSTAIDFEDCGNSLCDGAWLEYSEDGVVWKKLDGAGGTNWYNKAVDKLWSIEGYTRWHVATMALPKGLPNIRLRFVVSTDPAVTREGMAIDDIHVYDNTMGIYNGITMAAPVVQHVNSSNWIHFQADGKLVASIQPHNQNMGSTAVQTYIHTDKVRHNNQQYYHNRNLTIKPENLKLSDSVSVRFYFLDSETDSLISAKDCSSCSKPASAYELGVSKYTNENKEIENGTIGDNTSGLWSFITPARVVKVPFDKGYYAEFKVKDFSEFWLNNGSFNQLTPLPVKLMQFDVQKVDKEVLLQWTTAGEENLRHYESEMATGNDAVQNNSFTKIGVVAARGSSALQQYSFSDGEKDKAGVRYYRLKMVDDDGSATYSPLRSALFSDAIAWQLYPNPSTGVFYFVYQASAGAAMHLQVSDAVGKTIVKTKITASGLLQKQKIDLSEQPAGTYLLQMQSGSKKEVYKLYKQ